MDEPQASGTVRAPCRKYTPEERINFLAEHRASGLSVAAFAEQAGLKHSTFAFWVTKDRRRKANPKSRLFTPEERRGAVEAYQKSERTRVDFAKLWGCSPSSLDKWLKRYNAEGPKGLETRTGKRGKRPPHPKRLPDSARDLIVQVHSEHKDFGMQRMADHLARFHALKVSPSGVRKILLERGVEMLPGPRKRRKQKSKLPRRFERALPGQMWQSDITSFVLRRHNRRVYLTVFLDDHSRYVVAWRLASRQTAPLVIDTLLHGVARYGKPEEVLTDQGRQYYAWRGKSAFQKLLDKEGIKHVVSRTHHPQTLGKCERLWKTVGDEFWDRAAPQDLDDARERIGHWFAHYNFFRTHQGIDGLVPADRFFGAESSVRAALEAQQAKNALRLALDQPPRTAVYLTGQIGDQRIAMHGERGKLLVDTPDGGKQELSMEDLGIEQPNTNKQQNDEQPRTPNGPTDTGNGPYSGNEESATSADGPQTIGLQEGPEARLAGAGPVGERSPGTEGAGACGVHGDPGVLAGEEEQVAGGAGLGSERLAGLADEPEGSVGDDGGAIDAAAAQGGSVGLRGPRDGDSSELAPQGGGAGNDAGPDGRHGSGAKNCPMGDAGFGSTSKRRQEPCEETQTKADQEASRESSEPGSGNSFGPRRFRPAYWLRWLRR